jgi:hypothetical protein
MPSLRHCKSIARLMLVWFAMYLGAAMASQVVAPRSLEVICSSSGVMKVLVRAADGSVSEVSKPMLDCPACMPIGAPPPAALVQAEPAQPLAHMLRSVPAAIIAALTAAPPPGRGPPALS